VIWLGLMALFAGLGIAFWGSWWAVPFFLAHGVLYGSRSDSRWHESGHGTAFRSRWLDEGLLCDGLVMGDVIDCPKHNGRFDYTSGKALGAPVLVDLRTYPTRVIDGTVYIDVG
jgi:hypothetical protein